VYERNKRGVPQITIVLPQAPPWQYQYVVTNVFWLVKNKLLVREFVNNKDNPNPGTGDSRKKSQKEVGYRAKFFLTAEKGTCEQRPTRVASFSV
jgi:hypothetical protein